MAPITQDVAETMKAMRNLPAGKDLEDDQLEKIARAFIEKQKRDDAKKAKADRLPPQKGGF